MKPSSPRTPKVLAVHNYYKLPGGEDKCFEDEVRMLREHGHDVQTLTVHNDLVDQIGRIKLAARTVWNRDAAGRLRDLVRQEKFDVVHFHNTFPLLSPAVYAAARSEGAAVVQMLQNFRLLCPGAFLMRDGKVCEDCLGKTVPWPAIQHSCYRGSRTASAVVAGLNGVHRILGTWRKEVDVFLAMTEFGKRKYVEGGLPIERILVKPNFVHPAPVAGDGGGGYALFVGRLSKEKGLDTLLAAWKMLQPNIRLKIVGGGPLEDQVRDAAAHDSRIEYVGFCDADAVYGLMQSASCLVFPSIWYEGLPKTIIESFACGTPVLTSDIGAQAEVVRHSENGMHFKAGDAGRLAAQVVTMFRDSDRLQEMRVAARLSYTNLYDEAENYRQLIDVYAVAIANLAGDSASSSKSDLVQPHLQNLPLTASPKSTVSAGHVHPVRK
ncbi:MAG: glycosyltransferase [Planctomycetota bacterium]